MNTFMFYLQTVAMLACGVGAWLLARILESMAKAAGTATRREVVELYAGCVAFSFSSGLVVFVTMLRLLVRWFG